MLYNEHPEAPLVYSPEQQCAIDAMASEKPREYGNFKSINKLRERIENFIEYYNLTMPKAFKWTYKGKLLQT